MFYILLNQSLNQINQSLNQLLVNIIIQKCRSKATFFYLFMTNDSAQCFM